MVGKLPKAMSFAAGRLVMWNDAVHAVAFNWNACTSTHASTQACSDIETHAQKSKNITAQTAFALLLPGILLVVKQQRVWY